MHLFDAVIYHLSPSLSSQRQIELDRVLSDNGAKRVEALDSPTLTHLITNTNRYERWQDLAGREESGELAVVTDKWVDRSMVLGKLQPTAHYSADPAMIFSGVVACAAELPTTDLEVLSAGITALGGQWRTALTKDVTHLFAISQSSLKYTTALHFQEHTHIKVLLPHWFDDAVRLGIGGLDTTPYEWPDPVLLRSPVDPNEEGAKDDAAKKAATRKLDPDKRTLYRTASLWTPDSPVPPMPLLPSSGSSASLAQELNGKNVWQGRRVLLGESLELVGGRREAVEIGIKRAGGVVVTASGKEIDLVGECDVYVTRFRCGKAYVKAVRLSKTIGTLPWVFHVQSTGVLSPPMDQLLWYPIPKRTIDGFTAHEITVTNYTGESREYLKKLISVMGATFTPSMSGKNTVLIAAYISGTKTTKAASWSIPIVNHTWLEDCFVKWRNLTFALEKYIVFPTGVDFSTMLGERGVGRAVEDITEEELELLEREDEEEESVAKDDDDLGMPVGTENSARDAKEVESVIELDGDGDAVMDERQTSENIPVGEAGGAEVDNDDGEEDEESGLIVSSKPKTLSQSKSMASRFREREDTGSAAKTRVKKAKPKAPSPISEVHVVRRKSGQIDVTPAKGGTRRQMSGVGTTSGSDEVEVVAVMKTAEKEKPSEKKKLTRRAGERHDSWINVNEESEQGGSQNKSPKKKGKVSDDEETEQSRFRGKVKGKYGGEDRLITEEDADEAVTLVKARTKKITRKRIPSDSEEETIVKGKSKIKRTVRKASSNDDDEDSEVVKVPKKKGIASKKTMKAIRHEREEEEEEEEIAITKSVRSEEEEFARQPRTRVGKRIDSDDDGSGDDPKKPSRTRNFEPSPIASSSKAKGGAAEKMIVEDEPEDSGESEIDVVPQPKSKPKAKTQARKQPSKKDAEVIQERPKPKPRPITPKDKIKSTKPNTDLEDIDMEDMGPPSISKSKAVVRPPNSKSKTKAVESASSASTPVRTPKRVLSVLMPPLTLTSKDSPKSRPPDDVEMQTPSTKLTRTESIRATAGEHSRTSAPRPSPVTISSKSKSKAKPVPKDVSMSPPPPLSEDDVVVSGRSKRSAATKASQRLREEIMPDVMNYQQEMRNQHKSRKSLGDASASMSVAKKRISHAEAPNEDGNEERDKKRRKLSAAGPSNQKNASAASDEEDAVKIPKVYKSKRGENEDGESDAAKINKKGATKAKGADTDSSSKNSVSIRLMTTQVSLSEDVLKALTKLGVKTTTRPSECTHLLAPHLVRTEKFLCALSVAPFILTAKWATDSAAAKKLLNEKDYVLHDEVSEKKYDFVLSEALLRAKKLQGGLFAKKTFYVTPKVPIDIKLLKSVVSACGGQVTTQAPTIRIISSSSDKHVISCPEDISIWRPIAREYPIYTHELILTAALKQEVEWKNKSFRVPSS